MGLITYLADRLGGLLTPADVDGNFAELDLRTGPGWRDIPIPIETDATSPNAPVWAAFRGGQKKRSFAPAELTEFDSVLHVNHDYKLGTPIYLHVHWTPSDTSVGVVRWGFEFSVAKGHQQQGFPSTTTVYVEQATLGAAFANADRAHMVAEVDAANVVPATHLEPDTCITLRIFRDGGHVNDTYTMPVFGLVADAHYEADRQATPNRAPNFYGP
jgi:hypothetical protein